MTDALADTDTVNFAQMGHEFEQILRELPAEMGIYREEFEKLYNAWCKSYESEQRLIRRSKEIISEIHTNQDNILRSKEDETEAHTVKKRLQLDIEVSWTQVAESHKLEAEKQAKLNEIRSSIAQLKEQLRTGSGWSEEQEKMMQNLKRQKLEVSSELDMKTSLLNQLRQEVGAYYDEIEKLESDTSEIDQDIIKLSSQYKERANQVERQQRRRNVLDRELRQLKLDVEESQSKHESRNQTISENEILLKKQQQQFRDAKALMERYVREYNLLFQKDDELREQTQNQWQINAMLKNQNANDENELKAKKEAVAKISRETAKIEQLLRVTRNNIAQVDEERVKCEALKDDYKAQVDDLVNNGVEAERKRGETLRKRREELIRERQMLNKLVIKASDSTQHAYDLIKIHENTKKNLENEISGYRQHIIKQRESIEQLVLDREKYEKGANSANQKFFTSLEEVKLQEVQIDNLQAKIHEGEMKLKQQQNLYEAVRSDRNLYSKNLIESQEEISEMKRKFKIMNHQIEQLKEEITSKDHSLVKEHFEHHKVDKEKETLKNELARIRKQIQSSEQIIVNQEQEITKLSCIIQEADDEKTRQLKELSAVINDRDNLRSQLISRNEELSALYEKIKIQKSSLQKGENQFMERMKEVKDLTAKIQNLDQEATITESQVSHTSNLANEIHRLESELLHERTRIKALSEELERPLNVHRWRKLEGSDPQRFDMIRKIQSLQKKLIKKTEEISLKDCLIQEKEKLYVELKNVLARQPGPEVAEQLQVFQSNLKEKKRQKKGLQNELKMYKQQVDEYKRDISKVIKGMSQLSEDWLNQMQKKGFYESKEDSERNLQKISAIRSGDTAASSPNQEDQQSLPVMKENQISETDALT